MYKFIIAGAVGLSACGSAEAQNHFAFTDQLSNGGQVMTGTFDGTIGLDGIITNLSNINVFMDGVAFQGNGSLVALHYDDDQFMEVMGGAIASLDGTHNNFVFADVDYTGGAVPANYYRSLFDPQGGYNVSYAQIGVSNPTWGYGPVGFHAVMLAVPESASWAMMAGGFALAGMALRNRRRTAVRFG
jgi:hypothetical protein